MMKTRSTCPYCGVGCGVIIESDGKQITGVEGDPDHPANFGRLCTKGSTLHLTATAAVNRQTRLLQPMRRFLRGQAPVATSWNDALDLASRKFAAVINQHGPDSVGFYVSGQLLTEDYYVFNKLAKGLIGTNNIDTNSRLCMSSAVAGYKATLGADAPPTCYDDVNHTGCIFIVGSNTAFAHPVLFRRIEDARAANPEMKIIYVDPRRTDTAEIADLYLAIQPGTDVMLFNGMLHIMLWEGWTKPEYIAAHTNGFDDLKATVRDCTPDLVSQICGITKADLLAAARMFATSTATLSLYCQGLNQSSSGTMKNAALINLHLATAQIGKPGAGPFSLTGQPNAMGGREVGGLANMLSAHRDLSNAEHRAEVAAAWGIDDVPSTPGKTAVDMFQAAADGEIKALWIACTNPAQSMPDQATVRRALERAEFVVVQEAFSTTATCDWADLLLPATTWGEKEGTVTNSERRISRVRAAVESPGDTRHDWLIASQFADRIAPLLNGRRPANLHYPTPESVWNEHRELTRGRDLDITGMSYAKLDETPLQWPMREGDPIGKTRLYEDGVFPTTDGKAKFANAIYKPLAEPRESRFPFSLTTGRLRDQWHGMSRTGTVGRLFGHVAEPSIEMNAQDMSRLKLVDGDLVHITSKRGSIVLPVLQSSEVALTQAFIAMHWGSEFVSGVSSTGSPLAGVNAITNSAYCPTSKQPELKHSAVKILKAEMPWAFFAMTWIDENKVHEVREELSHFMTKFPFATCVPFSNNVPLADLKNQPLLQRSGLLFRAAAFEAPEKEIIEELRALLGLDAPEVLQYADNRRHQYRAARMAHAVTRDGAKEVHLEGFMLAGDISAQSWIRTVLQDSLPAQTYGRMVLAPGVKPPQAIESRGKPICSCLNVTDSEIGSALKAYRLEGIGDADTLLKSLQGNLKCGTSCGSCVPELKRMIHASDVRVAPASSPLAPSAPSAPEPELSK